MWVTPFWSIAKTSVFDASGLPLRMGHPLDRTLLLSLSLHPEGQPVPVLFISPRLWFPAGSL